MSQPNHNPSGTPQGGIPPFLPGLILIGVFALVMAILTPRADSSTVDATPQRTTDASVVILPTATVFIEPTLVPPTVAVDAPAATPGNVLTAIAVGAGPQAVTAVPTQSDIAVTPLVMSTTSSVDAPTPGNVLTAIAVGSGPQAVTSGSSQGDAVATTTAPSPTPSAIVPTEAVAAPPAEIVPVAVSGDPVQGSMSYQTSCAACHGFDAHGIPGLGKDLITSPFVHSLTDADLLQFIIDGRDASHPDNTTGIPMPSRGGNASLTDEQILNIIAYIRSESD